MEVQLLEKPQRLAAHLPFLSPPSPPQQGNKGAPQAGAKGTPGPPPRPSPLGEGEASPAPVTARTGVGSAAVPASRQGGLDPRGESRHYHGTIPSRSPSAPAPAPLQDGGAASPPTASVVPRGAIPAGEEAHGSQIVRPLLMRRDGAPSGPRSPGRARPARGAPAQRGAGRQRAAAAGRGGRAEGHGAGRITPLKGRQRRLIRFEKTAQTLPRSDWPAFPSR